LIPLRTYELWCPSFTASRITSRHHKEAAVIKENKPIINTLKPFWKKCIYNAKPNNVKNAPNEVTKGHGLGSTI